MTTVSVIVTLRLKLVWLADPYQFAAHGGVWSNAYTNFVLQEFIIVHHEYH